MFFTSLTELLLLPSILSICYSHIAQAASFQPTPCSQVFVLGESKPGGAAISKALRILGFTQIPLLGISNHSSESLALDGSQNLNTFTTLSSPLEYINVASYHPDAKFIVPLGADEHMRSNAMQPCTHSWLGGLDFFWAKYIQEASEEYLEHAASRAVSVREAFSDLGRRENLLEMVASEPGEHMEGKWLELCKFLGLGYSLVERLRLREFPSF